MNTIYTIGYEGTTVAEFIKCLKNSDIEVVADVRQHPFSRKAGFSQKPLYESLSAENIVYKHFPALGCPEQIRDCYKEDKDWHCYCDKFNDFLSHSNFALESLASYLMNFKCAIFCFEADAHFCHRLLVANAIKELHPEMSIVNLRPKITVKRATPAQLSLFQS